MNDKKCGKCGQYYKDSRSQKLERGTVERMLNMIHVIGAEEAKKETKDCCYNCWKERFRSLIKPYAEQLGKSVEDW